MANFAKLEKDGKIAVLYAPDYGAGWYTWNREIGEGLIFDREIVELVLAGDRKAAIAAAKKKYGEDENRFFTVGGYDLAVAWILKGQRFHITEYDGAEGVEIITPDFGHVA